MDPGYGTQSFDYDIHGWSTAISASYIGSDLFSESLRYASTQKPGTAARWDGNIAEASFTNTDGSHTYAYTYDGIQRLTDAKHYAGASNTATNARTERNFSYDRNGNITALTRYDEAGTGTPLSFAFTGNRIAADTYDAMGNLTRNSRNGLEFSYNLANLPESVEGADGASLTYSYLSDGNKWRASANSGPSILYRGSFVYEDDGTSSRISSIAWDEGRISIHDVLPGVDSLAVEDSLAADLGVVVPGDSTVVNVVDDGISDEWYIQDHLGSVRAIVRMDNSGGTILELNEYLPFGTRIPGSIQASDNRHRFSGKEEQRYGTDAATGTPAIDLGLLDFGARYYDPFTCRWTTRDPMAGKYLSLSPYNYCAGNSVNLLDLNGMDVYILLYTTDNSRGDEMFKASAETRKRDIENSSSFDSKNDIVILVGIQDMAAISSTVSSIVEAYSGDYGKTKEFSVWSHGGKDGPVGSIATSDFSLDTKQMTLEGWSNIDFNWGKNSTANFFGCNTGNGSPSFTTNVSNLENFENVTVNGQQSSSYPSIFTDTRTNNSSIINGSFSYPTYMVGSKRGGIIGHFFPSSTPAVPMSSSLNGIELNKKYYQNGRKH